MPAGRMIRALAASALFSVVLAALTCRVVGHLHVLGYEQDDARWGMVDFRDVIYFPTRAVLEGINPYDSEPTIAQGVEPRVIAEKLDVRISTAHTHLKHAREKLALPSLESLISFAARYCYPTGQPLTVVPPPAA